MSYISIPVGLGNYNQGAPSGLTNTTGIKTAVGGPFTEIRLIIYHPFTTTPTYSMIAAATETADESTNEIASQPRFNNTTYDLIDNEPSNPGWKSVTWNGGDPDITMAGTGSFGLPEVVVSDPILMDSVPRIDAGETMPLIMLRHHVVNAGDQGWAFTSNFPTTEQRQPSPENFGRLWQARSGGGDGVANPANILNNAVSTSGLIGIIANVANSTSIFFTGDSITENYALMSQDTRLQSWGERGTAAAGNYSNGNLGHSGRTQDEYTASAIHVLNQLETFGISPDRRAYAAWSPNSVTGITPTPASLENDIDGMRTNMLAFINAQRVAGNKMYLMTAAPYADKLTTAELDDLRKNFNGEIRAQAAEDVAILDFDRVWSDDLSPADYKPEYSAGDGIHPNENGINQFAIDAEGLLGNIEGFLPAGNQTRTGKLGKITIGTDGLLSARSWTIETTAEPIEDSVIGTEWRSYNAGLNGYTISIEGYYNVEDLGQLNLNIGTQVDFDLWPAGENTGQKHYSGTASVTAYSETASFDGMVEFTTTLQGTAILIEDVV